MGPFHNLMINFDGLKYADPAKQQQNGIAYRGSGLHKSKSSAYMFFKLNSWIRNRFIIFIRSPILTRNDAFVLSCSVNLVLGSRATGSSRNSGLITDILPFAAISLDPRRTTLFQP